jgi:hypothetical protein
VHPAAPAGGVLIQLVHLQDAVRFDAFKAADGALARSSSIPFGAFSVPVLALENLYAKAVALLMKLGRGGTMPPSTQTTLTGCVVMRMRF